MDKEYKVRVVQTRKQFNTQYGTFQSYGLQLDGFANGWVELAQKPETKPPVVGDVLYGRIETRRVPSREQGKEDMVFYKFKKGDMRDNPNQSSPGNPSTQADMAYVVQMLEELTGRRTKPESPTGRSDIVLEDIPEGEPFLEDNPFTEMGI